MILIADTSPIISLILIRQLALLEKVFEEYYLPQAVWNELQAHQEIATFEKDLEHLSKKVKQTSTFYLPITGIDKGETEAIILCQELKAGLLLVDDKKAREVAELLGIQCIGTLALLYRAKKLDLVDALRPLFLDLLENNRYYAKKILNQLLENIGEKPL